jgi:hypothetical protein
MPVVSSALQNFFKVKSYYNIPKLVKGGAMRLLLINKNPVVSRMMRIGSLKAGFEMEEREDIEKIEGEYDIVIVDDDFCDQRSLDEIKRRVAFKKIGIMRSISASDHIDGVDFVLQKPFLPADLGGMLDEVDEEDKEESPFVSEPLAKGGVLNEEEIQKVTHLLGEESEDDLIQKSEEGVLRVSSLGEIVDMFERLCPEDIKKVLAGMQLDITIKISYPDVKDV